MWLNGSDTALWLKHRQVLEGESCVEIYKTQKYPLHGQEYQKHFLHFSLRSLEKTSWSKFLQFWGLAKFKPLLFSLRPLLFLPLSYRDRQADFPEGKIVILLKMWQN